MMFRGTVHLLLYRLVYHELLIPAERGPRRGEPGAATSSANYLLYLRVSGQFHMACGMLHLFGFRLPETHHHYLLATGFTDYWRRINIYWKDFMVRIVFNPVVFRLKRRPQPVGPGDRDAGGVPGDLGRCTPTSRSGCGGPGASAAPMPCSGASSGPWCWSTSSSTRGASGGGTAKGGLVVAPAASRSGSSRRRPPSRRSRCSGRSGRARASPPGSACCTAGSGSESMTPRISRSNPIP